MKIVAICGADTVGKSTYARRLASEMGGRVLSFASSLKALTSDLFDRDLSRYNDADYKAARYDEQYTNRDLLKRVARAVRRTYGDDFFALQLVDEIMDGEDDVYIDDLREKVELETLKKYADSMEIELSVIQLHRNGFEYTGEIEGATIVELADYMDID